MISKKIGADRESKDSLFSTSSPIYGNSCLGPFYSVKGSKGTGRHVTASVRSTNSGNSDACSLSTGFRGVAALLGKSYASLFYGL